MSERNHTAGFRVSITAIVLGVLLLLGPLHAWGQTKKPFITPYRGGMSDKEYGRHMLQELVRKNSGGGGGYDDGRRDVYDFIISPQAKALRNNPKARRQYVLDVRSSQLSERKGQAYRSPIPKHIQKNYGQRSGGYGNTRNSSLGVSTSGDVIHRVLGNLNSSPIPKRTQKQYTGQGASQSTRGIQRQPQCIPTRPVYRIPVMSTCPCGQRGN